MEIPARWLVLAPDWAPRLRSLIKDYHIGRIHRWYGRQLQMDVEEVRRFAAWMRTEYLPTWSPRVEETKAATELDEAAGIGAVVIRGAGVVRNEAELIEQAGIDLNRWRMVRSKVNTWTTTMRLDEGVAIVPNHQVDLRLERRFDSLCEQPKLGPPRPRQPRRKSSDLKIALIVPDSQHGYRRQARTGWLEPLHDRRACDLAIQMAAKLEAGPGLDSIVLLGDHLDVAEWSTKYPRPLELIDTTRPALAEVHWWIRQLREAAPSASIRFLEGNHEARIGRLLVEGAPPAATVTAPGEDGPALGVVRLLGLDALGVEYVGPYGASTYLWDRVRVCHGSVVRSGGGATAAAVVRAATTSTIFGHVHRVEIAARRVPGPGGARTVWAMSPGCLCRVDGAVPSGTKGIEDWQQGLGVIAIDETTGAVHCQAVPIFEGRLVWDGEAMQGEDREQEIAAAIRWPALARE